MVKNWAALMFGLLFSLALGAASAAGPSKVVLQVSDNDPQKWNLAINNANNVLKAAPGSEIEIVVYGPGIGMLLKDSKVNARVSKAVNDGVKVVACQNTMKAKKLSKDQMNMSIGYVPAGVIEIMAKQGQGWAYVRP
ncbi:MAG: DsrE family protein [Burkholderiaceae bacterium]|jgi:intracellular sulfur oxidation DsrE/DsrF family protein